LYSQPLLAIAGSIIALATQSIYASLRPVFLPQALAQDIANLAPLWLLLARWRCAARCAPSCCGWAY
jgi:hypothetical protein